MSIKHKVLGIASGVLLASTLITVPVSTSYVHNTTAHAASKVTFDKVYASEMSVVDVETDMHNFPKKTKGESIKLGSTPFGKVNISVKKGFLYKGGKLANIGVSKTGVSYKIKKGLISDTKNKPYTGKLSFKYYKQGYSLDYLVKGGKLVGYAKVKIK